MKRRFLLPFLVYMICQAQMAWAAPVDHAPILPLKPAELITYLPPAPIKWTMLNSVASNTFSGGWITTYAIRNFKQIPPPPTPGIPTPPHPPVTMNVYVTDSGYKYDYTSLVTPPKGKSQPNTTYLQINDYPARMFKMNDTTTVLNFLVNDRFLVEIRSVNLPDDKLQSLAEAFDFSKLMAVPDTGETHLSDPVILNRIDGLNPQNSKSYPFYWSVAPQSK